MVKRLLLLLCPFILLHAGAHAALLKGEVLWQGEKRFAEPVRVERGGVLIVEKGARIVFDKGRLEVAGRLVADGATFTGKGWDGIVLKGCGDDTVLSATTVEGAKTGILVRGGAPRLRDLLLTGNDVGIELRQKTAATLSSSRFVANAKVGLFVKDEAVPVVIGNRFEANGRFGVYIHRSNPCRFEENLFEKNETGLAVTYSGSEPNIAGNRFERNGVGILVDRAARPTISGNLLLENETGIRLYRRSDATVEGNLFSGNEKALSVAFSSYPLIVGNDFDGNVTSLFLDFQSSKWERAKGEAARQDESSRRGSFGQSSRSGAVAAAPQTPSLDGTVDARGNWWGKDGTAELSRIGEKENPSFIHDGRDIPTFEEGGEVWPLDTVRFSPWSSEPLTGLTKEAP